MQLSLQVIAGVIGIVAYIVLLIGLLKIKIEQSFAAFMLWAALDIIASITTILENGNYWLPLSNAIGSSTITILLIIKKQIAWSWIETTTTLLVVICLVIWFTAGAEAGIISSSVAVFIASIPQMADTFKKPSTSPVGAYTIFLIANIISFIGGRSWTIEQRFYAGCSIALCLVIILFSFRKVLPPTINNDQKNILYK